jgi:inner membrane transporter RhtA
MNTLIYEAIDRIPLGAAVTLEVLGPLVLSVVAGRRPMTWLWALLALGGVVFLGRGVNGLDVVGVGFALAAAVMWAAYILLSARTGHRFPKADGLALAMTVAAAMTLPLGLAAGTSLFDPVTIGLGAARHPSRPRLAGSACTREPRRTTARRALSSACLRPFAAFGLG